MENKRYILTIVLNYAYINEFIDNNLVKIFIVRDQVETIKELPAEVKFLNMFVESNKFLHFEFQESRLKEILSNIVYDENPMIRDIFSYKIINDKVCYKEIKMDIIKISDY